MPPDISHKHLHKHVDRGLRWRLYIYFVLSIVILSAIIYRMIITPSGILYAVAALIVGNFIGIAVSRMYRISWNRKARKIIFRTDVYGIVILVGYFVFEIMGERYIRESFEGAMVFTIVLCLTGGAMFGRGIGISHDIADLLDKHV